MPKKSQISELGSPASRWSLTRLWLVTGKGALLGLGDVREAVEAYRSALSRRLLYPFRGEVEEAVKRLKGKRRKGSRA